MIRILTSLDSQAVRAYLKHQVLVLEKFIGRYLKILKETLLPLFIQYLFKFLKVTIIENGILLIIGLNRSVLRLRYIFLYITIHLIHLRHFFISVLATSNYLDLLI